MSVSIDLNSDLGEGAGLDEQLMPLVTSANIACGFHAGDAWTSWQTVRLAVDHGVVVGAHPGFPDREHFGRRNLERDREHLYAELVYQIGALQGLAQAAGSSVGYVKPHGALYNLACRDDSYAEPIVAAAERFGLALLGLPRSRIEAQARGRCRFVREGFADRRYTAEGTLVPRDQPDALITDVHEAVEQVGRLIREQRIESICVHGDNPQALDFIRRIRAELLAAGFTIRSFL